MPKPKGQFFGMITLETNLKCKGTYILRYLEHFLTYFKQESRISGNTFIGDFT